MLDDTGCTREYKDKHIHALYIGGRKRNHARGAIPCNICGYNIPYGGIVYKNTAMVVCRECMDKQEYLLQGVLPI